GDCSGCEDQNRRVRLHWGTPFIATTEQGSCRHESLAICGTTAAIPRRWGAGGAFRARRAATLQLNVGVKVSCPDARSWGDPTGSVTTKTVAPSSLRAVMDPPCARAISETMCRPSPTPL